MKKNKNILLIALLILTIIIVVPLIINILFKFDFNIWWLESEWSAGDALSFFGNILSFLGTLILGIIAIWQTSKSNELSEKILEKDLLESTDFIQLQNKIDIDYKENKDNTITMSTHHKLDYGANILIEPFNEETKSFNQYLIKIYFTNSSEKSHIKK